MKNPDFDFISNYLKKTNEFLQLPWYLLKGIYCNLEFCFKIYNRQIIDIGDTTFDVVIEKLAEIAAEKEGIIFFPIPDRFLQKSILMRFLQAFTIVSEVNRRAFLFL